MKANQENRDSAAVMQRLLATGFFTVLTILVVGALSLPFVYESQTLWYKAGVNKILLRAGQLFGMLALVSLIVQIILGTRGKFLETAFGVAALVAWHKTNRTFICCLATAHIMLVLLPEGLTNLPIGLKHWPEMVGGGLFLVIVSQVISSRYKQQLRFAYKQWRVVHRLLGYLALCLLATHVWFVADSFAHNVPRLALVVMLVTVLVLISSIKIMKYNEKKKQTR